MLEVDLSPEAEKRIKKIVKDSLRELVREQSKDERKEWVTAEDAAKMLGITPKHLRTIKSKFHCVRVGGPQGRVLFRKADLFEDYIVNKT